MEAVAGYLYSEKQRYPEYYQYLVDVAVSLPSPTSDIRAMILIPVHSSEKNLLTLLKEYTKQTTSKKTFELTLFLNRSEADPSFETLKTTIEDFQRISPYTIAFFEHTFSSPVPIGLLRKTLNDLALLRGKDSEVLLVNNDADALNIDPFYLEEFLMLHADRRIVTTQSQRYVPEAYAMRNFGSFVTLLGALEDAYGPGEFEDAFVSAWCGNFVIRADVYAEVLGFDCGAWIGEELILAHRFVKKFGIESFLRTRPRITTSCRRIAHAFAQRSESFKPYKDFFTTKIRHQTEENILLAVEDVADQYSDEDILKRLHEEFLLYIEKMNIILLGKSEDIIHRRFDIAVRVLNHVASSVGAVMNVRYLPDADSTRVTFIYRDRSHQFTFPY